MPSSLPGRLLPPGHFESFVNPSPWPATGFALRHAEGFRGEQAEISNFIALLQTGFQGCLLGTTSLRSYLPSLNLSFSFSPFSLSFRVRFLVLKRGKYRSGTRSSDYLSFYEFL